ncbi:MAG: phosphate signaling complex protein PhoU [Candidatus Coatesbacteria bacterium]|nr:phosphate signaling complex protein PhoU [Candidatus Coatesbacteria bacterium]
MSLRLEREIERLKYKILEVGALVEQAIRYAVISIDDGDAEAAKKVLTGDTRIDEMEVLLEEECLKILSLHQPVSDHLRLIIAVMKINEGLERMGDLAVNIAERALYLTTKATMTPPFNLSKMESSVQAMVKRSLDALVHQDEAFARRVIQQDDEIDEMNRQNYAAAIKEMKENPDKAARLMHYVSVSSQLERISDLATNIAEDVIYLVTGEIVRHKAKEAAESAADEMYS